jgi:hypothetical protein
MTAANLVKDNEGMWLALVCGVAAFGLLNTVLGYQATERVGTVSVTQVFDEDLGSMVVESVRPSNTRVVRNGGDATKHGKKGDSALRLSVGF